MRDWQPHWSLHRSLVRNGGVSLDDLDTRQKDSRQKSNDKKAHRIPPHHTPPHRKPHSRQKPDTASHPTHHTLLLAVATHANKQQHGTDHIASHDAQRTLVHINDTHNVPVGLLSSCNSILQSIRRSSFSAVLKVLPLYFVSRLLCDGFLCGPQAMVWFGLL